MIFNLSNLIIEIKKELLKNHQNLVALNEIFEKYQGVDWKNYIDNNKVEDKCYNKKYIVNTENFDLVLISWFPSSKSKIHNHPSKGCLMKIMEGSLKEILYSQDLKIISVNDLIVNQTKYIDNQIGYHKIQNIIQSMVYSLHIYSPGFYKPIQFDD